MGQTSVPRCNIHLCCANDDHMLQHDELLQTVFSYVGREQHLFVAPVSRRWRGLYYAYCKQTAPDGGSHSCLTSYESTVVTADRLQHALNLGLSIADLQACDSIAGKMCWSFEPVAVITLARAHGLAWSTAFCTAAAELDDLPLLQWLRSAGCNWKERSVINRAVRLGSTSLIEWVHSVTKARMWSGRRGQYQMHVAACHHNFSAVKWLLQDGVEWPDSYVKQLPQFHICWPVAAVQFALQNGAGWLNWTCQSLLPPEKFALDHMQKNAIELFAWVHGNGACAYGSPCTCTDTESGTESSESVQ
jgi:hypothetical protein